MLTSEVRSLLRGFGRDDKYAKGEALLVQGDPSHHVLLIEEGVVRVTTMTSTGYSCLLAIRIAGELVGEFAGVDGAARSATVTAVTDVRATAIGAMRFRRLVRTDPAFAMSLLRLLVARVRESDRRLVDFGAYSAARRIAGMLFDVACTHGLPVRGEPGAVLVSTQREELAGATGSSREAVSLALADLEVRGIVRRSRRHIMIRDLTALERLIVDPS